MALEIKLPNLGEGIHDGQVAKVRVSVGDNIAIDQTILDIEAGKAILEVPATVAGVVKSILVKEGEDVSVDATILTIEPKKGKTEKSGDVKPADSKAKRIAPEKPSEKVVTKTVEEPRKTEVPAAAVSTETQPAAEKKKFVPASPAVRCFAREVGVNIDEVKGSGISGRVFRDDIKRFLREHRVQQAGVSLPKLPDFSQWGSVRNEKMSSVRRATAEQLTRAWSQIPHVTVFGEADITELESLRNRYADKAQATGGTLTLAVMLVKIAASALKVFPKINASVDMEKQEIIFKEYVNIGIAIATERGLLVPVVRDVDRKNMVELASEITKLAVRTRQGHVDLEELSGGTFTVTNIGRIWGSFFTPLINYPEVAILGMGRMFEQAVCEKGKCKTRIMLPLSLSFDHRLIDGADAANFLKWIVDAIHEPLLLSLEG